MVALASVGSMYAPWVTAVLTALRNASASRLVRNPAFAFERRSGSRYRTRYRRPSSLAYRSMLPTRSTLAAKNQFCEPTVIRSHKFIEPALWRTGRTAPSSQTERRLARPRSSPPAQEHPATSPRYPFSYRRLGTHKPLLEAVIGRSSVSDHARPARCGARRAQTIKRNRFNVSFRSDSRNVDSRMIGGLALHRAQNSALALPQYSRCPQNTSISTATTRKKSEKSS